MELNDIHIHGIYMAPKVVQIITCPKKNIIMALCPKKLKNNKKLMVFTMRKIWCPISTTTYVPLHVTSASRVTYKPGRHHREVTRWHPAVHAVFRSATEGLRALAENNGAAALLTDVKHLSAMVRAHSDRCRPLLEDVSLPWCMVMFSPILFLYL